MRARARELICRFPGKVPKQGFQKQLLSKFPRNRFPSKVPRNRFQEKVPKNRFASKGFPGKVPKQGSQDQVPKQGSQEQVHKQGFQEQCFKFSSKGSKNRFPCRVARLPSKVLGNRFPRFP